VIRQCGAASQQPLPARQTPKHLGSPHHVATICR
jgi:hypothetical protein